MLLSPVEPPAVPPLPRWRELLWIPQVLLGTIWVLLVPALGLQASLSTWDLYGQAPSAAELAEQQHQFAVVVGISLAVVVLGLWLSVLARSTFGGVVFALLLVPTLVLALLWLGSWHGSRPAPPPAPREPIGCQEHSGGDARCPGG